MSMQVQRIDSKETAEAATKGVLCKKVFLRVKYSIHLNGFN